MGRAVDVAVVGGGVVGLAMARAILDARPGARVVVFDKEDRLGAHASGRNSGVIHAGFYYAPDSLKAGLTRRGNELLHAFCEEHAIEVRRCGKVVVAANEGELGALRELQRRGRANGVAVELIDDAALAELEPLARTAGSALWSPTTSVTDPGPVLAALADEVARGGGEVRLGSRVTGARPGAVLVHGRRWDVGHIVNCAGLQADVVARWFGFCDDYVVLPFKGLYWYGALPGLRRHVYPVPDPRNPFLGVHLTVTAEGGVKVGPTAIPALSREAYERWRRVRPTEAARIARHLPGLLTSRHHDGLGLVRSELPKHSRRILLRRARELVPSLDPARFRVRGRPGVRAQLWSVERRRLELDFVVRGDEASTHLLNIVSPGFTSALAMAEHVVGGMVRRGAV